MAPIRKFVTNTMTKMLFRSAIVSEVVPLTGHFRLIQLEGDELKKVAWIPGQKIQIHLGNLVCRTYTPVEWNPVEGWTRIVAFLHGNGPGSEWLASLARGAVCQFMGPRSSLDFTDKKGEAIFFGDETSIGAALAHQKSCNDIERNAYLFEVSSLPESQEVVQRLGLKQAKLIAKVSGGGHLPQVEEETAKATMAAVPPHGIFTGNAQSIQILKKGLRDRRLVLGQISTKAYWAYGKKGLD